jgi:uncharacterized protein YceH (UPF0502 family)
VQKLPRAPGAREQRWAHLLSGEPVYVEAASAVAPRRDEELDRLREQQQSMRAELDSLKALVARMASELGLS